MLTGLYWLSFGFSLAGTCILSAAFVGRRHEWLAKGLSYLATGVGMFGVWTAATVNGFMGAMLLITAIAIVIIPLKRDQLTATPQVAPPHSQDPVS